MIKIKDSSICETCKSLSCSFLRKSEVRNDFGKLSTETTVCPTQVLSEGPNESDLKRGWIEKDCVDCGLCIKHCPFDNIVFDTLDFNIVSESFKELTEAQLKATVMSMLGFLFTFSANTNRNRALQFDGFISSKSECNSFVEIDWHNDSLECTRRLLGDILTYKNLAEIKSGLIILQEFPAKGSRDVYNVLDKISEFPTTKNLGIYITTIPVLRWIMMHAGTKDYELEDIGFNPILETKEEFLNRINSLLPEYAQLTEI